jgi:hypothetical protein
VFDSVPAARYAGRAGADVFVADVRGCRHRALLRAGGALQACRARSKEYSVNRYTFEAERHWNIVNEHLAGQQWMLGETYTLVDMAVWGWARMIPRFIGDDYASLPYVKRHLEACNLPGLPMQSCRFGGLSMAIISKGGRWEWLSWSAADLRHRSSCLPSHTDQRRSSRECTPSQAGPP